MRLLNVNCFDVLAQSLGLHGLYTFAFLALPCHLGLSLEKVLLKPSLSSAVPTSTPRTVLDGSRLITTTLTAHWLNLLALAL
jgi:hypothetical protein